MLHSIVLYLINKVKHVVSVSKTRISISIKQFGKLINTGFKYCLSFFNRNKTRYSSENRQLLLSQQNNRSLAVSGPIQPRFSNIATENLFTLIMNNSQNAKISDDGREIKELIEQGADPFAKDHMFRNNSLLLWAIANAKITKGIRLLNYLIQNYSLEKISSEINHQCNDSGYTALHLAVCKGWEHVDDSSQNSSDYRMKYIIQKLIECGADPNIQDNEGNTPLHIALMRQDWDCARYLIQAGAKQDIINKKGKVPYDQHEFHRDMLDTSYEEANNYAKINSSVFTLRPFMPIKGFHHNHYSSGCNPNTTDCRTKLAIPARNNEA